MRSLRSSGSLRRSDMEVQGKDAYALASIRCDKRHFNLGGYGVALGRSITSIPPSPSIFTMKR